MVEQSTARDYALHQLAQLGPSAGKALGAVVPMLQDERPLVRYPGCRGARRDGSGCAGSGAPALSNNSCKIPILWCARVSRRRSRAIEAGNHNVRGTAIKRDHQ